MAVKAAQISKFPENFLLIDVCADIYVMMNSNLYGTCSTVSMGLDRDTGLLGQVSWTIQDYTVVSSINMTMGLVPF